MPPRRTTRPARGPPKQPSASPPPSTSDREIHTAFSLFSKPLDSLSDPPSDLDSDPEDTDLIPVPDARKALKALSLPPPPADFFDPAQRFVSWPDFRELARTLAQLDDPAADNDDDDDDIDMPDAGGFEPAASDRDKGKATAPVRTKKEERARQRAADVEHAFALFTQARPPPQGDARITMADLRRVARELREEVDDAMLKRMILVANGEDREAGRGWQRGVGREEFEGVMKRAGVLGRGR